MRTQVAGPPAYVPPLHPYCVQGEVGTTHAGPQSVRRTSGYDRKRREQVGRITAGRSRCDRVAAGHGDPLEEIPLTGRLTVTTAVQIRARG